MTQLVLTGMEPTPKVRRQAEISDCGRYRWWLRRTWVRPGELPQCVTFVMLNPSKADANIDDATIRRCIGFAHDWGFNMLSVRNLFPYRATDKRELLKADDPTGGDRGDSELLAASTASMVVVAWGEFVPFLRDQIALQMFAKAHCPLYCLGQCSNGKPRHPVRLSKTETPRPYAPEIDC